MHMRQKLRIVTVFAAVSLTLFSIVGALVPQTAKAAGAGSFISSDVLTQVKNHQKYYWLRNCFFNSDIDDVTRSEMSSWDFFEGAGQAGTEIVGAVYGANEDATWSCTTGDNVEVAFNALGVTNPREAFCKIDGARYNDSDKYDYAACTTGAGDGEWDNTASSDTQGTDFEKEAKTWAPDVVKPITDVQNYVRYYLSFINQCDVTIQAGKYEEGSADDDDKYMVPVVNYDSKSIQNRLGIGTPSDGSQVAIVATKNGDFYYNGEADGGYPQGEVISCNDAVNKLRGFAQAYQDYLNKNPDLAETPVDAATTGSQKPTCESEGGAISWLACPVLKLLDMGIDFLSSSIETMLLVDESKYNDSSLVQAWRVMRNVALLILIPMMLLMVIGTALEFGPFDAYTVRKSLPRMVIAVMFITLSLPITQFLVNLSNVVGSGLQGIILSAGSSPETLADLYSTNGGLLFTTAAAGGIAGIAWAGVEGASLAMLGSLALTVFLALLIGYLILVIRELLIIVLIMVAPLAILVWIFPANDKLWKIWKTTFTALLMMYPLIAILIASGKVFAGVIGDVENDFTAFFLKIIAFIAPFFFIPATFKYGLGVFGNIAGVVNDRGRGLFDRQKKYRAEKRAQVGERVGRRTLQSRGNMVRGLQSSASKRGKLGRAVMGRAAEGLGGYNMEAALSARTASVSKELNDQIATGADGAIRGLSVNKKAADRSTVRKFNQSTGTWTGPSDADALKRVNDRGATQYKTLGGAWVDAAEVDEGHRRWGNDTFAKQASLSYEMRKAMTSNDVQGISDRYAGLAKEQWKMSDTQAGSAWIGAGFENQNQHIEYKNTDHNYAQDSSGNYQAGTINASKFANELYEKKGSHQLSQMSAHTMEKMREAYDSGDEDTKRKIQSVAETFMSRYGSGSGGSIPVDDGPPVMTPGPGGAAGRASYQTNSQGAGHVAEEVRKLAVHVGVYGDQNPGTYTESGFSPLDPPRHN